MDNFIVKIKDYFANHLELKYFLFSSLVVFSYLLIIFSIAYLFAFYPFEGNANFIKNISVFDLLNKWDSVYYRDLIQNGYNASVFFPLYPLACRFLMVILGLESAVDAGYLFSWFALGLAVFYFYRLLLLDYEEKVAKRGIMLMLLFPASFFFALIYTESLFLFLSIATVYYLKKKDYFLSALFMAGAVLTRNVGVFLGVVYLYQLYIETGGSFWHKFKSKRKELVYLFLPIAAMLGFMAYCQIKANDYLIFIHGQAGWAQFRPFTLPWNAPAALWDKIKTSNYNLFNLGFKEAGSYVLLLAASFYFLVRKKWFYGLYTAMPTILFSFFVPYYSVNRFIVVVFPVYIMLMELTAKREFIYSLLLMFFVCLLVFNTVMFASGSWIG